MKLPVEAERKNELKRDKLAGGTACCFVINYCDSQSSLDICLRKTAILGIQSVDCSGYKQNTERRGGWKLSYFRVTILPFSLSPISSFPQGLHKSKGNQKLSLAKKIAHIRSLSLLDFQKCFWTYFWRLLPVHLNSMKVVDECGFPLGSSFIRSKCKTRSSMRRGVELVKGGLVSYLAENQEAERRIFLFSILQRTLQIIILIKIFSNGLIFYNFFQLFHSLLKEYA